MVKLQAGTNVKKDPSLPHSKFYAPVMPPPNTHCLVFRVPQVDQIYSVGFNIRRNIPTMLAVRKCNGSHLRITLLPGLVNIITEPHHG